jgi:phage shock protein PspC (stress-responsive transcriptional regulator)
MSSIWTIRRSTSDAKLAGLCGGMAKHWGVDPVLVRVAFALLALSAGMGVVLYLAGWLLLPVEGRDKAPVDDLFGEAVRKWPKEVWIAVVTLACVAMFAIFGSISPFSIGPAVVIAVIWYFGFYKPRQAKRTDGRESVPPASLSTPTQPQFVRYPGPATPFTEAAEAWRRRIEENARRTGESQGSASYTWPVPPPSNFAGSFPRTADPMPPMAPQAPIPPMAQPRYSDPAPEPSLESERGAFLATPDPVGLYVDPPPTAPAALVKMSQTRSARRLRLITLILVGLTMSGLGVAEYLGASIPLAAYFGSGLLVVGIALILATWLGRARGLLALGVLLSVAALISSAAAASPQLPKTSSPPLVYTSVSQLPAGGDHRDVGQLTVDLSQLKLTSDLAYKARVDLGRVEVIVPKDVNVVVHYSTDLGKVRAYGTDIAQGTERSGDIPDPDVAEPGQPTLALDLSLDVGNIEVRQ